MEEGEKSSGESLLPQQLCCEGRLKKERRRAEVKAELECGWNVENDGIFPAEQQKAGPLLSARTHTHTRDIFQILRDQHKSVCFFLCLPYYFSFLLFAVVWFRLLCCLHADLIISVCLILHPLTSPFQTLFRAPSPFHLLSLLSSKSSLLFLSRFLSLSLAPPVLSLSLSQAQAAAGTVPSADSHKTVISFLLALFCRLPGPSKYAPFFSNPF